MKNQEKRFAKRPSLIEPFKNLISYHNCKLLAELITCSEFDGKFFLSEIKSKLNQLELKSRVDLVSHNLFIAFKQNYLLGIKYLIPILDELKKIEPFMIWPVSNYIALYGITDLDKSAHAMLEVTKKFTSEFCIRYYIEAYEHSFYTQYLNKWVHDDNEHVRRLVSEGTRPKLPWGIKVRFISENLKLNTELLTNLKDDPSVYVRKSVANHLNDIAKINPALCISTLQKWGAKTPYQKWLRSHALRWLIKQGNEQALELQGRDLAPKLEYKNICSPQEVKIGGSCDFSFTLHSCDKRNLDLELDYILSYPNKKGDERTRVLKGKKLQLLKDERRDISARLSFKPVTTRVYYSGKCKVFVRSNNRTELLFEFILS